MLHLHSISFVRAFVRVFKTAWFARAARKARIDDRALCAAANEINVGQSSDLGGGVAKKRLNRNLYRGIVLAKGGRILVFVYLYAKNDRTNIGTDELSRFRDHAKEYEQLTNRQLTRLLDGGDLNEICSEAAKV